LSFHCNCYDVLGTSQVRATVDLAGASDYSRLAEDDCPTSGDTFELERCVFHSIPECVQPYMFVVFSLPIQLAETWKIV